MRQVITYPLQELVEHARTHSPFYRELYRNVTRIDQLADLPIVDQSLFWQAAKDGQLLAGDMRDGIIFKSGGTTGQPKFSAFTQSEWETFTSLFGRGISASGGIRAGDRVANIFYAGELYASFLFIMRSLDQAPIKTIQFPLAGTTPMGDIVKTIREFDINVIAGVPTSILMLAGYLTDHGEELPSVRRILYGGEAMYADQMQTICRVIPTATCQSIGWASVDGGLLGYFGEGCQPGEHRVFDDATILEIVDEGTGEPIEQPGIAGKLLLTNLTRMLMPIIRYPVGDCGMWTEPVGTANRKIRLTGRSDEGARVGPATVYLDDIREVLAQFGSRVSYGAFQIVTIHRDGLDELTIRVGVAGDPRQYRQAELDIVEAVYAQRQMLAELLTKQLIHPLQVQMVPLDALEKNPRTGKLRALIDRRQ